MYPKLSCRVVSCRDRHGFAVVLVCPRRAAAVRLLARDTDAKIYAGSFPPSFDGKRMAGSRIRLLPEARGFVCASDDGVVSVISTLENHSDGDIQRVRRAMHGHSGFVTDCDVAPQGRAIVSSRYRLFPEHHTKDVGKAVKQRSPSTNHPFPNGTRRPEAWRGANQPPRLVPHGTSCGLAVIAPWFCLCDMKPFCSGMGRNTSHPAPVWPARRGVTQACRLDHARYASFALMFLV